MIETKAVYWRKWKIGEKTKEIEGQDSDGTQESETSRVPRESRFKRVNFTGGKSQVKRKLHDQW